jgi:NAD(P)-dependent dehydrogenase (short-subunit alcohol dehydrogenase family)
MAIHLVTGSTDGIGLQTALELAKAGAAVLVHGRSEARATEAVRALQKRFKKGAFEPVWGDLSSMRETAALGDRVLKTHPVLDVLLNNAGVFMTERQLSADGFEMTMAVNHFSHFVLTHRLLPALKAAPQGRVVHVSSMAHVRGKLELDDLTFGKQWDGHAAYSASKLANIWFSNELARRLASTQVTSNALHPGVIDTKLLAKGFGRGGAGLAEGARTSVYCATEPKLSKVSGEYFSDRRKAQASAEARDAEGAQRFYEESCRLTGVAPL